MSELILAVLTPVVAFLLKLGLDQIGSPVDEATFNAIVISLVGYIVSKLGLRKAEEKGLLSKG